MEVVDKTEKENLSAYKMALKKGVTDPFPYDRLMIHYRKGKDYKNELQIIIKAIKIFERQLENLQKKALEKNKKRSTIEKLSNTIGKSTGLLDKKGKAIFIPEPIARWLKRKKIVEKKIAVV